MLPINKPKNSSKPTPLVPKHSIKPTSTINPSIVVVPLPLTFKPFIPSLALTLTLIL